MTTAEVIAYYQALLITQYERGPRARGTIAAFVGEALADQLIAQVRDGFNFNRSGGLALDTARGAQLDTLGEYRGVAREVYGISVARTYWQMPYYGQAGADTDQGFLDYGTPAGIAQFLTYDLAHAPLYALHDSEMARLIQLRALSTSGHYSVADIDAVLYAVFGQNVGVFEDSPMHITYADLTGDSDTLFDIAVATNSLPRPAGVQMVTERLPQLSAEFGLQIYGVAINPAFVGYSLYGTPRMGSFMRYF